MPEAQHPKLDPEKPDPRLLDAVVPIAAEPGKIASNAAKSSVEPSQAKPTIAKHSRQHYRDAPPPPSSPLPPSRFRAAISDILRTGFNIAGSKNLRLDENAESAEIFVLSGIFLTALIIGGIWILLQQALEPGI